MIVTTLWNVDRGFLSEWEGRDDRGHYVVLRCKREIVELRVHPRHRPGMDDTVAIVALPDGAYDSQVGPTYVQLKEALEPHGHVLPAADDGVREEIPERPPFPGYEGPGIYVFDWSAGTGRRVDSDPGQPGGHCMFIPPDPPGPEGGVPPGSDDPQAGGHARPLPAGDEPG